MGVFNTIATNSHFMFAPWLFARAHRRRPFLSRRTPPDARKVPRQESNKYKKQFINKLMEVYFV